jgi:hypothetical protein
MLGEQVLSDLFDLCVGLVCLVTGRELGWDGVVIIEVDVGGVRSLRNVGRRVENAVVIIGVVVVVVVVIVIDIVIIIIDAVVVVVDAAAAVVVVAGVF